MSSISVRCKGCSGRKICKDKSVSWEVDLCCCHVSFRRLKDDVCCFLSAIR